MEILIEFDNRDEFWKFIDIPYYFNHILSDFYYCFDNKDKSMITYNLANAHHDVFVMYLRTLETTDRNKYLKENDCLIIIQANNAVAKYKNRYRSFKKEDYSAKVKVDYDENGKYCIEIDKEIMDMINFEIGIFKIIENQDINSCIMFLKSIYENVDKEKVKTYLSNIFMYNRINRYIEFLIDFYEKKVGTVL